jgi:hypothetical protein
MQLFQPSSVFSEVEDQPVKEQSIGIVNILWLCHDHDWLRVLSLMGTLRHHRIYWRARQFKPSLGAAIDVLFDVKGLYSMQKCYATSLMP